MATTQNAGKKRRAETNSNGASDVPVRDLETAKRHYRQMVVIRLFEEACQRAFRQGKVPGADRGTAGLDRAFARGAERGQGQGRRALGQELGHGGILGARGGNAARRLRSMDFPIDSAGRNGGPQRLPKS